MVRPVLLEMATSPCRLASSAVDVPTLSPARRAGTAAPRRTTVRPRTLARMLVIGKLLADRGRPADFSTLASHATSLFTIFSMDMARYSFNGAWTGRFSLQGHAPRRVP